MLEGSLRHRPPDLIVGTTRRVVFPARFQRGAFIAATLVLTALPIVGLELLLRLTNRAQPIVSGWRVPQTEWNRLQLNQLGFRGVPIEYSDDDYVVLLVGDSQVEAEGCSYYWLPERRLEHYLSATRHVRVFSLGAYGWGQDQQLLSLREYLQKYRADLVIVWETPGNDVWNNTFPTGDIAGRQPKPTFWLENGELRGPTSSIGDVISSRFRLLTLFEKRFVSWDREWEKRLPSPYVPMSAYNGPVKNTWQSLWDQRLGNISTDDMSNDKNHQAIYLTPRSPRTQYGITVTHRLLEEMSREAIGHGGAFMTFHVKAPNMEVDLGEGDEAVFVLNGKYYRVSERQKAEAIAEINAGFSSYVVPVPTGEWRISPTDGHLNEHAVDDVMRQLAGIVATRTSS